MKRGILAVVMAAVAALFLVEVSMEELFIHRRLQQTMAQDAILQDAPEVMTVVITDEAHTPLYLLLCGREGRELRICSVEPDTQIPDPQGGMTTLRGLGAQKGIRPLVSGVSDALGVHTGSYLVMDTQGACRLVDAMGGIALPSDRTEHSGMLTGQQVEQMLMDHETHSEKPELMLLNGMVQRVGTLSRSRLPSLAVQGMKYVKTNISLLEQLEEGSSLVSSGEVSCKTMVLPGTIPAIWSGSRENRQCSYDLGQAAGRIGRFFAGKE